MPGNQHGVLGHTGEPIADRTTDAIASEMAIYHQRSWREQGLLNFRIADNSPDTLTG
jgi:hypothetical protein